MNPREKHKMAGTKRVSSFEMMRTGLKSLKIAPKQNDKNLINTRNNGAQIKI